jgi:cytochrome c biogenesis protein CcdA
VARLLVLVASIAIADSANPATIAPSVYFATTERPLRRLAEFIGAFFAVNLIVGLVIVLGPGELLLAAVPDPGSTARDVIELAVGIALLMLGAGLIVAGDGAAGGRFDFSDRRALGVGAALAAVELPTAFPYFAALAAIVGSGVSLGGQLLAVLVFNVIFISPVLAAIAALAIWGDRALPTLKRMGEWLRRQGTRVFAVLALLAGAALVVLGVAGLAS